MASPFFTIIIPTFNSEKTLEASLLSIISQSFQCFEVLIIDGLSTDTTVAIATSNSENHSNIKWFSEKDKGIYDAMNKGIKLAKGEWLYFLGSDDKLFQTNVLEKIAQYIKQEVVLDVLYGNVYSGHFNGIYDGEFSKEKIFQRNICHQAIFIKKSVFKKVGVFNKRYKIFADWDHNLRWFLSDKINKQFYDIIIADYGEGGISSSNWDDVFGNEKQFNYLLYGHRTLSFNYKFQALKSEFIKAARLKKLKRMVKLLTYSPLILLPNMKLREVRI